MFVDMWLLHTVLRSVFSISKPAALRHSAQEDSATVKGFYVCHCCYFRRPTTLHALAGARVEMKTVRVPKACVEKTLKECREAFAAPDQSVSRPKPSKL